MSELFDQGGLVLAAIAALSVVAWFVLIGQWLDLRRCERCCRAWERRDLGRGDGPRACAAAPARVDIVGRLLHEGAHGDPRRFFAFENLESALDAEGRVLLRHLALGGEFAALTPLLGLLGTILGMLQTFGVLAVHGARDVGGFAEGISHALVTTEAGLIAALPILVLHGWLGGKARRCLAEVRLCVQRSAAALWPGAGEAL
jgi:biopolymer transport protein ExbB